MLRNLRVTLTNTIHTLTPHTVLFVWKIEKKYKLYQHDVLCTHFRQINNLFLFVSSFSKTGLVRHVDPVLVPAVCHVNVEVDPIQEIVTETRQRKWGQKENKIFHLNTLSSQDGFTLIFHYFFFLCNSTIAQHLYITSSVLFLF